VSESQNQPPVRRRVTTRIIARAAFVAALYAALTIAVAPISYGPIQFRVSEALKALVIVQPWLIPGIMAGTFVANLFSPYVGPWELIWMPLTDGLGGLLAWWIGRRWWWAGLGVYALTTAGAVGVMLHIVAGFPLWLMIGTVFVGEIVVIPLGWPIARSLDKWGMLR
jgi:uncharacterized membrane protein